MALIILCLNVLSLLGAAGVAVRATCRLLGPQRPRLLQPGRLECLLLLGAVVASALAVVRVYGLTGIPRCLPSERLDATSGCLAWTTLPVVFPGLLVLLSLMPLMLGRTMLAPLAAAVSALMLAAGGVLFMSANDLFPVAASLLLLAAAILGNARLARSGNPTTSESRPD